MTAREPSEARKSAAAARRAAQAAEAAVGEAAEPGVGSITFEEMQAGYETQIGQMASQIIQQGIVIRRLQAELLEKREKPA